MGGRAIHPIVVLVLAASAALGQAAPPRMELDVQPREATIGDPIAVRVEVFLEPGTGFVPPDLGERFGEDLEVLDGSWSGPAEKDDGVEWTWSGRVAAYRVGKVEVPALRLEVKAGDGVRELSSSPISVEIRSVLPPEETRPEPADLKAPVSLPPAYGPLWLALGILALLLGTAWAGWRFYRRFLDRLAAVPQAEDPFGRMPPHEWVYAALQELLGRGWAEQGKVDLFHEELARILKRYLSARYRVDLIEHTTGEASHLLAVAGAPEDVATRTRDLLRACDRVKFARAAPDVAECRGIVEVAYGIVDATRPQEPREGAA